MLQQAQPTLELQLLPYSAIYKELLHLICHLAMDSQLFQEEEDSPKMKMSWNKVKISDASCKTALDKEVLGVQESDLLLLVVQAVLEVVVVVALQVAVVARKLWALYLELL